MGIIMLRIKKYVLLMLVSLCGLLAFAGASKAQTWTAVNGSTQNYCVTPANICMCPSSYTYGTAVNANCTLDSFLPGCWNPSTGKCNTCGQGGTVVLGQKACFNSGQSNVNLGDGSGNVPMGTACTTSAQCPSAGSSGGFSTN
jgi:hypothetical protein